MSVQTLVAYSSGHKSLSQSIYTSYFLALGLPTDDKIFEWLSYTVSAPTLTLRLHMLTGARDAECCFQIFQQAFLATEIGPAVYRRNLWLILEYLFAHLSLRSLNFADKYAADCKRKQDTLL